MKPKGKDMNANAPKDDDAPVTGRDEPGVVVSRRHFTRAGLSGSVVLGSLASKPVLGASSTYHCTVSGQVSGNLSRAEINCATIGNGRQQWLDETSWLPIIKGTLSNPNSCAFGSGRSRGTNFNRYSPGGGVPALVNAFFARSGGGCTISTDSSSDPRRATMLEVLNTNPVVSPFDNEQFQLGRATVISLLNYNSVTNYPVTAHTIIAMFNATFNGGSYQVVVGSITVPWNRTRVIQYLSSLYPA